MSRFEVTTQQQAPDLWSLEVRAGDNLVSRGTYPGPRTAEAAAASLRVALRRLEEIEGPVPARAS